MVVVAFIFTFIASVGAVIFSSRLALKARVLLFLSVRALLF
jgi:hypothetical protein